MAHVWFQIIGINRDCPVYSSLPDAHAYNSLRFCMNRVKKKRKVIKLWDKAAIENVAFTGRVVCIGYSKEDILFSTKLWVQKALDIRGSRNAVPEDFKQVISYLKSGTIVSKIMVK